MTCRTPHIMNGFFKCAWGPMDGAILDCRGEVFADLAACIASTFPDEGKPQQRVCVVQKNKDSHMILHITHPGSRAVYKDGKITNAKGRPRSATNEDKSTWKRGNKQMQLRLEPDMRAWVEVNGGQEFLRELIRSAMDKEA